MKISTAQQGSDEWKRARAGVITASMFHAATKKLKIGSKKGEPTDEAHDYAFKLALERISGEPIDDGFETWAMARGRAAGMEMCMDGLRQRCAAAGGGALGRRPSGCT